MHHIIPYKEKNSAIRIENHLVGGGDGTYEAPYWTDVEVYIYTYPILKMTRYGYWIDYRGKRRFIKLWGKNLYCYLSLEKAKLNFIARKKTQIHILNLKIKDANTALWKAERLKEYD